MGCRPLWLSLLFIPVAGFAFAGFSVDSPTLVAGAGMPIVDVYSECGGGNVSPPLQWHNPPSGTQSFAVTVFDPDAPGGFWHWIAFNIPAGAHGLNAGAGAPRSGNAPGDAVQLHNDFGNAGYSGPCPPAGKPHHYVITVYALDVPELGIAARFDRKIALAAIKRHSLASARLTVMWGH